MLPILASKPLDGTISSLKGAYQEPCATCRLNDICVQGCCATHHDCVQRTCNRGCNSCGGGDIRGEAGERGTPAICCKAPLRDMYIDMVRKPQYAFKRRPLLDLKARSIVVSQGSPGRIAGCPYPEDTEAVAVNLRHVWSERNGWYSHDMRDYLRLPSKRTKLILITSTHDDVLERAWNSEVHREDFASLGFDIWQSLTYSQYHEMSRFNNLWQGFRTLTAIEASGAHFSTLLPHGLRLSGGEAVYAPWRALGERVPQLMLNWQYTSLKEPEAFVAMLGALKRQVSLVPTQALWFVGVCTPEAVFNIQKHFPGRPCYFLSVVPWILAHKGAMLNKVGKMRRSKLAKADLMHQNQHNFHELVAHAVAQAEARGGR